MLQYRGRTIQLSGTQSLTSSNSLSISSYSSLLAFRSASRLFIFIVRGYLVRSREFSTRAFYFFLSSSLPIFSSFFSLSLFIRSCSHFLSLLLFSLSLSHMHTYIFPIDFPTMQSACLFFLS